MELLKLCKKTCPKMPIIRKCCCCVPIRKGIIIFGYVNLVLSLLSFPLLVFLLVEQMTGKHMEHPGYTDPMDYLPFTNVFVLIDVIMTIVLLIGAHKKMKILLKVYFYFGVVFQLLTLCIELVFFDYKEYVENTVYFIFIGLNVYLLLLVYSAVHIIEDSSEVQYIAYQEPSSRA